MAGWMITSVSSRLKLGFFLLVVGFALATGASLWANFSVHIETKALAITGAVCLIIAVTSAGKGVYLQEARASPIPKVLAGVFGILGCIFYIAAAALRIDWHRRGIVDRHDGYWDPINATYRSYDYDYPSALVILGAIFALMGAIFCLWALAHLRLDRADDTDTKHGEVKVHRAVDTDGDGRADTVKTTTYAVNE